MNRSGSRARRPLGLFLCALIVGSSVAAPLMERGGFLTRAHVESEHDPATCAHPHDHRICTQVGANLSFASRMQDHHVAHVFVDVAPTTGNHSTRARPQLDGPPSRAPPLA